jgi:prepilin-type N-terminal cleavage/methylation domain-containing protein
MRFTQNTKGFTLIELLVVITIIGILAVGGTATYTSQIQKARDSTRMTDLNALRSWVEQYYQDYAEYPDVTVAEFTSSGSRSVLSYVPKIPKDSKSGQLCARGPSANAAGCDYVYNVTNDVNGILKWRYRLSTAFENSNNVDTKASKDGGTETGRFEVGLQLNSALGSTNCERTTLVGTFTSSVTRIIAAADCNAGTNPAGAVLVAGN